MTPLHMPTLKPGVHAAPHWPAMTVPLVHWPFAPQVCGVCPLHCCGETPGVHAAPHCPAVMLSLFHCPMLPQLCGVPPLHLIAFGNWHMVPSQHPPSHVRPPLHVAEH